MQQGTYETTIMAERRERPQSMREDSFSDIHPALHPSITNVPVTPGVALSGKSSYFQSPPISPTLRRTPQPFSSAGSNFSPSKRDADPPNRLPDSPTHVVDGARTGAELLRRLSLIDGVHKKPELVDLDPRAAHPGLQLSGGVISVTFCIPHSVGFKEGADWV